MDEDIYRILALRVREERRRAGLTLERLAERAGITGAFVAHIEAGRKRATLDTVSKLARALGLATAELLQPNHGSPEKANKPFLEELARLTRGMGPKQRRAMLDLARAGAKLGRRG